MSNQIERAIEILRQGGSVYMHKNDVEGLKDKYVSDGGIASVFGRVKICTDHSGMVQEGNPVVALIGGDMVSMNVCLDDKDAAE